MIEPGDIHAGRNDTDDVESAAAALVEAAVLAEPALSAVVRMIAAVAGGAVERFETRFKGADSVRAKLERFRADEPPAYRLGPFNDALRYTVVFPDLTYWRSVDAVVDALSVHGLAVKSAPRRWEVSAQPTGRAESTMTGMEYFRLSAGARGWLYVRIDSDAYTAECFDVASHRWVQTDAYYDEVYHNGNGEEITEAEALAAIGALQSA